LVDAFAARASIRSLLSVLGLGRAKMRWRRHGHLVRSRRDGAWSFWPFGAVVITVSAVRQIVRRHFGNNPWQRLHQEVACGPVQRGMFDLSVPKTLFELMT
jgi:hypothetical protein